ncbi:MAG: hypothetical protein Q4F97_09615, partial [Bacteroidales bacterium]|nr:hypothetical protein [Bacteroidales bacterium]
HCYFTLTIILLFINIVFLHASHNPKDNVKYIFINKTFYTEHEINKLTHLIDSTKNESAQNSHIFDSIKSESAQLTTLVNESKNEINNLKSLSNDSCQINYGISVIISLFRYPREYVEIKLAEQLALCEKYNIPILIKLDCEVWMNSRSDLWNWWDKSLPGYNPKNIDNVERFGWEKDKALKIGWLNWGRQIRMLPMINLYSKKYRKAVTKELRHFASEIYKWQNSLPNERKYLFGGIVLGWESSIGVTNYYYTNGNDLLDKNPKDDPVNIINIKELPSRGVQTIGYAAVESAKIANDGVLNDTMQAEVIYRHLRDMSKIVFDQKIPKTKIYTHTGGWKKFESLYNSALNEYSLPGWSFYEYAFDVKADESISNLIKNNNINNWGAVEWLLQGSDKNENDWINGFNNAFDFGANIVSIYNFGDVVNNKNAIKAIAKLTSN